MVTLPLYVKKRDASGATGPAVLYDTVANAREIAAEFRLQGFPEVWVEDTDGRIISKDTLQNA